MDRLEPMECEPECVVGGRMDREYTLHLRCRLATRPFGVLALWCAGGTPQLCCIRTARLDEQPTRRVPGGLPYSFAARR